MADEAAAAAKPKKHSAFAQVVFRRFGEAFDLGGKAVVGLAGFGSAFKARHFVDVDWPHLLVGLAVGGAFLAPGIYLQAKAEET